MHQVQRHLTPTPRIFSEQPTLQVATGTTRNQPTHAIAPAQLPHQPNPGVPPPPPFPTMTTPHSLPPSSIGKDPEGMRQARLQNLLNMLRVRCAICWAKGSGDVNHDLSYCPQSFANGRDHHYTEFRCRLNFDRGVCFSCGIPSRVNFSAI
jgi:hypothetical protein